MLRHHHRLHRAALWLALSAVVLRSLIPIGFMPGWIGAVPGSPSWLVICPASELQALLKAPSNDHAGHPSAAPKIALAATAGVEPDAEPAAAHCPGHASAAASPVTPKPVVVSAVDDAAPAGHAGHDAHEGHDPAQHAGHRIAAEHQSCPFAAAATPALALAPTAAPLAASAAATPDVVRLPVAIPAAPRRLPPARAPPARIDDRAVA